MTVEISAESSLGRMRELRKRKAWRAIIELGESLSQPNRSVLVLSELGKAYLEARQYDAARLVLQVAKQLEPRSARVHRRLGQLECAVGNYQAALQHWQVLKKKKGERADSSIFLNLAKVLRNLGRLETAKLYASEGHERFPRNVQLRHELRRITAMLHDLAKAAEGHAVPAATIGRHPYCNLDRRQHWNKTVSPHNALEICNWYQRKFSLSGLSISSAGSCFAQHIGRALRENGYDYVDVEPAPNFLRPESHRDYSFGIYSARFGNIYTSRQLLQLVQRSLQNFHPHDSVWEKEGGYVDAFRPTVEPEPFQRLDDLRESRENHLAAVKRMFKLSNVFVFTMGLTETWMSNEDGAVYPVAPGVAGGIYDPTRYVFKNLTYQEALEDMEEFIKLVLGINSKLKIILTVSPVPLMATASFNNVVVANSYSKSVLRSVAGYLCDKYDFVDYFPSYEIIGSHVMRGLFFDPDGRTVSSYGVSHVMAQFFGEHVPPRNKGKKKAGLPAQDDVVCDEELLNEFGAS